MGLFITIVLIFWGINAYLSSPYALFNFSEIDGGIQIDSLKDDSIAKLTIPAEINGKRVVSIQAEAFRWCSNLEEVVISEGVLIIGEKAFSNCLKLSNISIPNSVISINEGAFNDCHNLKNITIPEGITYIADFTFFDCVALESITLPNSIKAIGWAAFGNARKDLQINYHGTKKQWESIQKQVLGTSYVVNCTDGTMYE